MNNRLQKFARETLKENLAWLSLRAPSHCLTFKRMYSHNALDRSLSAIVDSMPVDQLDWAMEQVQNSLDKAQRI